MVAGLEPECTNSFLLALANAASDSNIDNHEAVRRCLEGEEPGSGAAPKKVRKLSSVARHDSIDRQVIDKRYS